MTRVAALIVAAGESRRMAEGAHGTSVPKPYLPLAGIPMLRRSLTPFLMHPAIGQVQVVIHPNHLHAYEAATKGLVLQPPAYGGATRQASVLAGLERLAGAEWVLIHDAARPFVSKAEIDRVLQALEYQAAVVCGVPVVDTIKAVNDELHVVATPDRNTLWQAQTPQGFHLARILEAHHVLREREYTDDAALAEAHNMTVLMVPGERRNFKVTTPDDLIQAEQWLGATRDIRTAMGFDVHRFGPGDHVMLGGVRVPHERGLEGHSDADLLLHAVTDALLGTVADGDIGQHFSPKDPKWKGADSRQFVTEALRRVHLAGGELMHVDMTLVGEEPKVSPHREVIRAAIAALLGLPVARVSVKATTTEGLGFTGRREGLAAYANATVAFRDVAGA